MKQVIKTPEATSVVTAKVMAAAQEIKTLKTMVVQFAQMAEARIMERLWEIHREIPKETDFKQFVVDYLDMDAERALQCVATWSGARQNRKLRELAQQTPSSAMALIQRLADGGLISGGMADDVEVTRLLSMPPKKRYLALRDLIATKQHQDNDHHPVAREQIKALTVERDAALTALEKTQGDSKKQLLALADEIATINRSLGHLAGQAESILSNTASPAVRSQILGALDTLIEQAEHIMQLVQTED